MHRSIHSLQRGAALIEVLLSVTVIAIGFGASTQTLGLGAQVQKQFQEFVLTEPLRQAVQEALRGQISEGSNQVSGRLEKPYDAYRWEAQLGTAFETVALRPAVIRIMQRDRKSPVAVYETLVNVS